MTSRSGAQRLHAILHDPGTRRRGRRSGRALLFAADQARGARRLARTAGRPVRRFLPVRYDQLMLAAVMCSGVGTALRPPRRRSARRFRLIAAGVIASGVGLVTNLAISIWWPSHDGFGSAFLASALTVSLIFWWQASRRPRRQVQ